MPRKCRVEHPGAIYHLMSRPDGQGDILLNEQPELETLKEQMEKAGENSTSDEI